MKVDASIVLYESTSVELESILRSLLEQKRVSLKILIFDNSKKETVLPIHSPEISYTKSKVNIGFGSGHNENYKASRQDAFFLVINPDVNISNPHLLEEMCTRARRGLYSTRILELDGSIQAVHRNLPSFSDIFFSFLHHKFRLVDKRKLNSYLMSNINKKKNFHCPNVSGCFMLFTPSFFKTVGMFDTNFFLYFEDVDISRRVSQIDDAETLVFGDLYVYHSWKRSSYNNLRHFYYHIKSCLYYFFKWGL